MDEFKREIESLLRFFEDEVKNDVVMTPGEMLEKFAEQVKYRSEDVKLNELHGLNDWNPKAN